MFIEFAAEKNKIVEASPKIEPQSFLKNGFQHYRPTLNFYWGFVRNRLGQNDRNDCGIISGVHPKCDFDKSFTSQSHYFPESPDCYFLCLINLFIFGE